jgi:hypothetical protein
MDGFYDFGVERAAEFDFSAIDGGEAERFASSAALRVTSDLDFFIE